jgi:L-ascorbate metabolism protein UlaG (beta-lactamase superfamily)
MERTEIALALGAVALAVAGFSAFQAMNTTQASEDQMTEQQVRDVASSLDDEQPSRHGEPLYGGSAMGYVIDFPNDERFYISGDSGPMWTMENYINPVLDPTVSFFSAGNVYTADMETAAWEAAMVDSETSIPIHYGTFPFLDQDTSEFENTLADYRDEGETDSESQVIETGEWTDVHGVETMWVGHGTLMFKGPQDTNIMVDPWVKTNPEAPQDWKDNVENIPRVDIILLTHGHLDHYTPSMIRELQDMHNSTVVAEWELAAHMSNQGFSNVVAVNKGADIDKEVLTGSGATGGVENMPDDMQFHTVWAKHSSSPATTLGEQFGITVEGEIAE